MLKLYLDDTGTHEDSPIVGVGGFIGTEAQWAEFDGRWRAVLESPLPGKPTLSQWHSYDCRWGLKEFSGYSEPERDRVTCIFRDVITQSGLVSLTNFVDVSAWNEVLAELGPDKLATGETTALYRLLMRAVPFAAIQKDGPDIAVFYDLGRLADPEVGRFSSLLNDPTTAPPHILSLTFLRVADATPLQGADMIATETFWFVKEFQRHGGKAVPRPHFASYLRDNEKNGNGEFLDREAIIKHKMTKISGSSAWQWNVRLS